MKQREEGIIPFEIKAGEYYSIIKDDSILCVFISNGEVKNYPNGDFEGVIEYRMHACLFAVQSVFNPVVLGGPEIDKHGGVRFPREIRIRYANDKERNALDKKLEARGYEWDSEKKEIKKLARKRKSK